MLLPRSRRLGTLALLLLVGNLAGCLEPDIDLARPIKAFRATYGDPSDPEFVVELVGIASVLDQDGSWREAYEVQTGSPGGQSWAYLDGNYRTVARVVQDNEGRLSLSYLTRGGLPAFGIMLPAIYASEQPFVSLAQGLNTATPAAVQASPNSVTITLDDADLDAFQSLRAGSYRFVGDEPMAVQSPYGEATVVVGDALPSIGPWPMDWSPSTADDAGIFGSAYDPSGSGLDYRSIIAGARESNPAFVSALDDAECILEFLTFPRTSSSNVSTPAGPVLGKTRHEAHVHLKGANGNAAFRVTIEDSVLGRAYDVQPMVSGSAARCAGKGQGFVSLESYAPLAEIVRYPTIGFQWYGDDPRRAVDVGQKRLLWQDGPGDRVLVLDAHRPWIITADLEGMDSSLWRANASP